jgi:hypothetical protein
VIVVATRVAPAYIDALQFNDYIRQEVKYAVAARRTTDSIRTDVLQKAKELNIGIGPRDIRITQHGPAFTLELDYSIPVDLRVYQRNLDFHVFETGVSLDK